MEGRSHGYKSLQVLYLKSTSALLIRTFFLFKVPLIVLQNL